MDLAVLKLIKSANIHPRLGTKLQNIKNRAGFTYSFLNLITKENKTIKIKIAIGEY